MEWKPILIIGSKQANAFVGSVEDYASCITAACGMGGGHIPMIIEEKENDYIQRQRDKTL
jgi:hypothetical protein